MQNNNCLIKCISSITICLGQIDESAKERFLLIMLPCHVIVSMDKLNLVRRYKNFYSRWYPFITKKKSKSFGSL